MVGLAATLVAVGAMLEAVAEEGAKEGVAKEVMQEGLVVATRCECESRSRCNLCRARTLSILIQTHRRHTLSLPHSCTRPRTLERAGHNLCNQSPLSNESLWRRGRRRRMLHRPRWSIRHCRWQAAWVA